LLNIALNMWGREFLSTLCMETFAS